MNCKITFLLPRKVTQNTHGLFSGNYYFFKILYLNKKARSVWRKCFSIVQQLTRLNSED